MTLDLATILTNGGPAAVTCLLGWFLLEARKELKAEKAAHDVTRASHQELVGKIMAKAGVL